MSASTNDTEYVISYTVLAASGAGYSLFNSPEHQEIVKRLSGEWKVRDIISTPTGAGSGGGYGGVVVTVFLVKSKNDPGSDYARSK